MNKSYTCDRIYWLVLKGNMINAWPDSEILMRPMMLWETRVKDGRQSLHVDNF